MTPCCVDDVEACCWRSLSIYNLSIFHSTPTGTVLKMVRRCVGRRNSICNYSSSFILTVKFFVFYRKEIEVTFPLRSVTFPRLSRHLFQLLKQYQKLYSSIRCSDFHGCLLEPISIYTLSDWFNQRSYCWFSTHLDFCPTRASAFTKKPLNRAMGGRSR